MAYKGSHRYTGAWCVCVYVCVCAWMFVCSPCLRVHVHVVCVLCLCLPVCMIRGVCVSACLRLPECMIFVCSCECCVGWGGVKRLAGKNCTWCTCACV